MRIADIPTAEIEYLAGSDALKAVFDEIERDALEQMVAPHGGADRNATGGGSPAAACAPTRGRG